jgi:hypothetical protein
MRSAALLVLLLAGCNDAHTPAVTMPIASTKAIQSGAVTTDRVADGVMRLYDQSTGITCYMVEISGYAGGYGGVSCLRAEPQVTIPPLSQRGEK